MSLDYITGMNLNGAGLLRLDNTAIRSIFPEKVQWRLRQRFARFTDSLKVSQCVIKFYCVLPLFSHLNYILTKQHGRVFTKTCFFGENIME